MLDYAISLLNAISSLPGHVLVGLTCLIVGYALRFIRRFPNDGIPLVSILWGMVINPLLADVRESGTPLRLWLARNIMVGLVIGAVTWALHRYILKKIEEKIPILGPALADADRRSDEHTFEKIVTKKVDQAEEETKV